MDQARGMQRIHTLYASRFCGFCLPALANFAFNVFELSERVGVLHAANFVVF